MKAGRLSTEERDQITHLADRGLKASQIARRLDRHRGTVNFAMHAMGLTDGPIDRAFDYIRNGSRVVSFSRDEDAWIQALRIQGYATTKIAALAEKRWGHPRSAHTIVIRLKQLANVESCS